MADSRASKHGRDEGSLVGWAGDATPAHQPARIGSAVKFAVNFVLEDIVTGLDFVVRYLVLSGRDGPGLVRGCVGGCCKPVVVVPNVLSLMQG